MEQGPTPVGVVILDLGAHVFGEVTRRLPISGTGTCSRALLSTASISSTRRSCQIAMITCGIDADPGGDPFDAEPVDAHERQLRQRSVEEFPALPRRNRILRGHLIHRIVGMPDDRAAGSTDQ